MMPIDPNSIPSHEPSLEKTADHIPADDTGSRAVDESSADPNRTVPRPAGETPGAAGTFVRTPSDLARLEENAQSQAAEIVPGYVILGMLGKGGMGVVYKARHIKLNRIVALKMMLSEHASRGELIRFLAEAEAVAAIKHANVVQVFDYGEADGRPFMALEYLSGGNLKTLLPKDGEATRSSSFRDRAQLLTRVARGVAAAHALGIVHRDLKPANVLLDEAGTPKVADFGLAKHGAGSGETQEQQGMGTPAYMAPEQVQNAKFVSPQADVWALGVILYELLTGSRPFTGTVQEILAKSQKVDPVTPRKVVAAIPRDLELICLKCLAKAPHERYPTARELADDLDRYLRGEPISVRPAGPVERAYKAVLRNQLLSGATAAVILALMVGLGFSIGFGREANKQAEEAKKQKKEAEEAAEREKGETARANLETQAAIKARDAEGRAKRAAQAETARAEGLLLATRNQQTLDAIGLGNIRLAKDILNDCQWHLRNWECGHLWTRVTPPQSFEIRGMASSIAFSSDGTRLAASSFASAPGGRRTVVRVWELSTGRETILPTAPGDESVYLAAGSGDELLGVRADLCVQRWNLRTGQLIHTSKGNPPPPGKINPISHVCFSPDRKLVAFAPSISGLPTIQRVRLWDVEKDALAGRLSLYMQAISVVRFSPAGTHVASAGADRTVRVWDLKAGTETEVKPFAGSARIWFTPDGKYLFTTHLTDNRRSLRLWDVAMKKEVKSIPLDADLHDLAFTADGQWLATGESDGRVRVWKFETGEIIRTYYGHASTAHLIQFSPDGKRLASADYDGRIHVWDTDRDSTVPTLSMGKDSQIMAAAFSPDGKTFATGSRAELRGAVNAVSVWDTETGRLINNWRVQTPQDRYISPVHDIAYSPDGTRIATCGEGVKLWDARTGTLIRAYREPKSVVFHLAFSPDGKRLYAAPTGHGPTVERGPADVWVWDVQTGQQVARFTVQEKRKSDQAETTDCLVFAPNGQLVTGTIDASGGVIKFWNTADHTLIRTLTGHPGRILSVAFNRDGTRMASSCQGDVLIIWDAKTGRQLHKTRVRGGQFDSLRFSADGTRVFAGCSDGSIRVWDPELFQEMLALPGHTRGNAASRHVRALALSPDGKRLVSGGSDGSIRIWESLRMPEYADLKGHRRPVTAIAFAPASSKLFAWDKSGELLAWSLRDGSPTDTAGAPPKGETGIITSPDGRYRAEPVGSLFNENIAVRVRFLKK